MNWLLGGMTYFQSHDGILEIWNWYSWTHPNGPENDQKIQNWWIFYDYEQLYAAWAWFAIQIIKTRRSGGAVCALCPTISALFRKGVVLSSCILKTEVTTSDHLSSPWNNKKMSIQLPCHLVLWKMSSKLTHYTSLIRWKLSKRFFLLFPKKIPMVYIRFA